MKENVLTVTFQVPAVLCIPLCLISWERYLFSSLLFSLAKALPVEMCSQDTCSESPRVLVKIQSLRLYLRPTEVEPVGVGQMQLLFCNKQRLRGGEMLKLLPFFEDPGILKLKKCHNRGTESVIF